MGLIRYSVLLLTVAYLPLMRLYSHAYDCIGIGGEGRYHLLHDVDIDCSSPGHKGVQVCPLHAPFFLQSLNHYLALVLLFKYQLSCILQAVAALLMLLLGFGIPAFVVWQVWSIANADKLSDSRMLDIWGALYDVYRAPAANGAPTSWSSNKVFPNKGDVTEKDITKMHAFLIKVKLMRDKIAPHFLIKVKMMRDKIALHYLAVEMVQKVLVVMSALPL